MEETSGKGEWEGRLVVVCGVAVQSATGTFSLSPSDPIQSLRGVESNPTLYYSLEKI